MALWGKVRWTEDLPPLIHPLYYWEKEGQNLIWPKFPVTSGLQVTSEYSWGTFSLFGKSCFVRDESLVGFVLLRRYYNCLEWLWTKPEHHLDRESYSSFKDEPKQVNLLWLIPSFERRTFFIFQKLQHLGIVKLKSWVAEEKSASYRACQNFGRTFWQTMSEPCQTEV